MKNRWQVANGFFIYLVLRKTRSVCAKLKARGQAFRSVRPRVFTCDKIKR